MRKNHYDIVHTHTTKAGILGRIAARIAGVPVIVHGLHGSTFEAFDSWLLNWLLFLFERLTGRFTDAYISVSGVLSEKYVERRIGKKENYHTVYSGMQLETFYGVRGKINCRKKREEFGIGVGDFIIGNVARLETRKGHKFLIDAFKNVVEEQKDNHVKLLIIGEGNKREYLESYVHELNLNQEATIDKTGKHGDFKTSEIVFLLSSRFPFFNFKTALKITDFLFFLNALSR